MTEWNYGYNMVDTGRVLNTGERPIKQHHIQWCAKPFTLRRVVVGDAGREAIVATCSKLRVLCVAFDDGLTVVAGDIWAGVSPASGFNDLAEVGWLRTSEAEAFAGLLDRLIQDRAK